MKRARTPRALAAALAACGALTTTAAAAVHEPPVAGHSVIVFPERDFVSAEGYPAGAAVTFNVIRNGVTIGAGQATADAAGLVEINHPGGGCWDDITPDILPGDKVRVTVGGESDQTTTANVTAEAAIRQGNDIVVRGKAQDASGNPLPVGQIEQRIIAPDLVTLIGKRRLQAPGDGTLQYDTPGSTDWTARYTGFSNEVINIALAGETRILWLGADPLAGNELTIFEVGPGVAGGPAAPCTAPAATMAVTSFDRAAVNLDNVGADMTVSGLAFDATSVTVRLSDGTRTTDAVVVSPSPSGHVPQTWSGVIPAAQLASLAEGRVTATAEYLVNGTVMTGVNKALDKDTVSPPAPAATPKAGAYASQQSVTLSHTDSDPSSIIRFTVDGTQPSATSTIFGQPLVVTGTQTIRAMTMDRAGNRSGVADFAFTIGTGLTGRKAGPRITRLRAVCVPVTAKRATVKPKCRPGVAFVLSSPARVTFVVTSKRGRKLGEFRRILKGGRHTIVLPEKVGTRTLLPGAYVLQLRGRLHGVSGAQVATSVTIPKPSPPPAPTGGATR